jgi:hypothetical protein
MVLKYISKTGILLTTRNHRASGLASPADP